MIRFLRRYSPWTTNAVEDGRLTEDINLYCSVCIVHHHSDRKLAMKIRDTLLQDDLRTVWIDEMNTEPDFKTIERITEAIEQSDAVVFLLSPESNDEKSGQVCLWMLDQALEMSKRIVPVYVREVPSNKINKELVLLRWIFFENTPFRDAIMLLRQAIDQEAKHVQWHTELLRKAKHWKSIQEQKAVLLKSKDIAAADTWLLACYLGKEPQANRLQLRYIKASKQEANAHTTNKRIAFLFGVIVLIGIGFTGWGVFFMAMVFSHTLVYFSSYSGRSVEDRELETLQNTPEE